MSTTLLSPSIMAFPARQSPFSPPFSSQFLQPGQSHATMTLPGGLGNVASAGVGRGPVGHAPYIGTAAPARPALPPVSAHHSPLPHQLPGQFSYFERSSTSPQQAPTSGLAAWAPPPVVDVFSLPRSPFPSPHLGYMSDGNRANSLSPTRGGHHGRASSPASHAFSHQPHTTWAGQPSYPVSASSFFATPHPTPDAAVPGPTDNTSSAHMVQRLANQNSRLREAWEMERSHLEANRKRAEEVYREEWAIMDEFRESWEIERATMVDRMRDMAARLEAAERENAELKSMMRLPTLDHNGAVTPATLAGTTAPGLTVAVPSGRPGPSPMRLLDETLSPPNITGPPPFIPVTSQSDEPRVDFLPSPRDEVPLPIIDVQTLHPELEGIPIRATAIQRSTFTDNESSPKADSKPSSPTDPNNPANRSPKKQTLEALAAEESKRLTLHAGHTPSHSLSILPSVAASTIADTSQGSTPAQAQAMAEITEASPQDMDMHPTTADSKVNEATGTVTPTGITDDTDNNSELLESTEDAPMKAPIMIRNIPAKDEEFWRLVNAKLEPISRGEHAVPTVMRKSPSESTSLQAEIADQVPHKSTEQPTTGTETKHADEDDGEDDGQPSSKAIEEIPLRFKQTSNFGAPFGQV